LCGPSHARTRISRLPGILRPFSALGRLSEGNAHLRLTTVRGTTQRGQRWTIVADSALAAAALDCFTAIDIAWLASISLFRTRFVNISGAPSRPPPSKHDKKQDLDVIFGSITFQRAHRQDKALYGSCAKIETSRLFLFFSAHWPAAAVRKRNVTHSVSLCFQNCPWQC